MTLVGPGSVVQDEISPDATLAGAGAYEYVTILNPLTDDFAVAVAQDIPVNLPFELKDKSTTIQTEGDIQRTYGVALTNRDFQAKKHLSNQVILKAGETLRMRGNDAQVAVRQLVNEILQREGMKRFIADPVKRKEVEDRIIVGRGTIEDLMSGSIQSPQEQALKALNNSNEVQNDFPDLKETTREATSSSDGDNSSPKDGAKDSRTKTK